MTWVSAHQAEPPEGDTLFIQSQRGVRQVLTRTYGDNRQGRLPGNRDAKHEVQYICTEEEPVQPRRRFPGLNKQTGFESSDHQLNTRYHV